MSMVDTFRAITAREGDSRKSVIEGCEFRVVSDCPSEYGGVQTIPAGTVIVADFAGDFGMYGVAEVGGVLHKVKIPLCELHNIDFGPFDARTEAAE